MISYGPGLHAKAADAGNTPGEVEEEEVEEERRRRWWRWRWR